MEKVTVDLGERSYEIVIGEGILAGLGERLKSFGFTKIAVVSNPTVFPLYGDQVMHSLKDAGFDAFSVLIPDGEEYKDYATSSTILAEFLKRGLDRNSCVVALGGGVIGDISGFTASIYMRGIHFVQVPTTLLAQVDSSVGGKTGVNHPLGKNMIGTFYQPRLVWIDVATLRTLLQRDLISGIGEVIKYGIIWDPVLFDFMEKEKDDIIGLDVGAISYIIKRSCEIKAEVVSSDERETGLRAILNFGHTIGHAVETETQYTRYRHGEAVGLGMCAEVGLAELLGLLPPEQSHRIKALVSAYGLPCSLPDNLSTANLIAHMKRDKKVVAGEMTFILPERVGKVIIRKGIAVADIEKVLAQ